MNEQKRMATLLQELEEHIRVRNLKNAAIALPAVQNLLSSSSVFLSPEHHVELEMTKPLHHALSVTGMLLSLNLPLAEDEEDLCLAAGLCHVLPQELLEEGEGKGLRNQLNPRVFEISFLVSGWQGMPESVKREMQARIQADRLAILVALADRSDLMGRLYNVSSWRVHQYINETLEFIFPLCVYAKENYSELYRPVSTLLEKMRSLIEVNEIFLNRYEMEENALARDILFLKEENARLRVIIRQMRESK